MTHARKLVLAVLCVAGVLAGILLRVKAFLFLGAEAGHARRSNYAARVFRPAADGIYPAEKRRRGYRH